MPVVYPTDWLEACFTEADQAQPPDYADVKLNVALKLLQDTHGDRYDKLNINGLHSRMEKDRATGIDGNTVRGLRVFVFKYDASGGLGAEKAKIAAFFFVRLKNPRIEKAYCMTVGVDQAMSGAVAYSQLKKICKFMQTQPENRGIQLEVVNSERHLKHVRKDSSVLGDVLDNDAAAASPLLVYLSEYESGSGDVAHSDPWFPSVKRWLIKDI